MTGVFVLSCDVGLSSFTIVPSSPSIKPVKHPTVLSSKAVCCRTSNRKLHHPPDHPLRAATDQTCNWRFSGTYSDNCTLCIVTTSLQYSLSLSLILSKFELVPSAFIFRQSSQQYDMDNLVSSDSTFGNRPQLCLSSSPLSQVLVTSNPEAVTEIPRFRIRPKTKHPARKIERKRRISSNN